MHRSVPDESILAIDRPNPRLWQYYILRCLAFPPALPIALPYHWFRYHSMRYRFTPEGVSMSWGVLFRHEIVLNYARIQDIHVESNVVERWLGLARLQIQTASGSAAAEMTLEGLPQFEAVRDFLYAHMRGVRDDPKADETTPATSGVVAAASVPADSLALADALRDLAGELRELRQELARLPQPHNPPAHE
jgi:putative membrane protein